ncbi:MAG: 2,5-dihydroxypyridine 5,6-dioxygenase [Gaiellaceae bacterium]|nr:2,5-dihydroxypyridine 5,6-dioxygenase [Gaiellaceae bacterium]
MSVETATHYRTATLVPLFQKMLERCKVKEDETVLVVTDPDSSQEYAAAMFAAARSFKADVMTLVLPPAPPEQASFIRTGNISSTIVANSKKALEFLKMADFVIDMTSIGLLHTKEQVAVLESGTRMLMVHDPVEVLERLFPEDEDKVRVQKHAKRMRKAKRIRLESDNGTDAWFDMDGQPVIEQWGWTDEPGRWDHWPGAFQYTSPTEGLGEGVIVLDPGDIWYPPKRYIADPVKITFEGGFATKIEGGVDATMINEYISGWNDPEGYAMSHLGWGTHKRALWNAILFQDPLDIIGQDGRTAWGNTLFALGSNVTFGGTRTTGCHQDFALKNHRFYLDDELIADSGKIIPDYLND